MAKLIQNYIIEGITNDIRVEVSDSEEHIQIWQDNDLISVHFDDVRAVIEALENVDFREVA